MDDTRWHPRAGDDRWRGEDAQARAGHQGGHRTGASLGAWAFFARHPALCSPSNRVLAPDGSLSAPRSASIGQASAAESPITVGTLTPDDVYEEDYAEDYADEDDGDYDDEEAFFGGESRQHRTVKLLLSGGIAGVISRSATAPLDRLKMLLQVNDAERRMTMKEGLRIMAKEGTVKSFFKGNGTNVLKIAPGTSIGWMDGWMDGCECSSAFHWRATYRRIDVSTIRRSTPGKTAADSLGQLRIRADDACSPRTVSPPRLQKPPSSSR